MLFASKKNVASSLRCLAGVAFALASTTFYVPVAKAQTAYKFGKLKYGGGGDWYANKTSLPNLIAFCNRNLDTRFDADPILVEPGSPDILGIPVVHATGHGNIVFTPAEASNLRKYLISGGFLHVDDNYGLDKFIRREMKKVFPEADFVELPFTHPIYHQKYDFARGLPKVHEHDNKPAQGFGLFYQGRMVCFYTYECDLGNGWEDQAVYKDPEAARQQACVWAPTSFLSLSLSPKPSNKYRAFR